MGDVCIRGLHVRAWRPLMTVQDAEHVNTAMRGICSLVVIERDVSNGVVRHAAHHTTSCTCLVELVFVFISMIKGPMRSLKCPDQNTYNQEANFPVKLVQKCQRLAQL